jgi:hypothetical protein
LREYGGMSVSFHPLYLNSQTREWSFHSLILKLLNRGKERIFLKYSFFFFHSITFHSILFPPPKRSVEVWRERRTEGKRGNERREERKGTNIPPLCLDVIGEGEMSDMIILIDHYSPHLLIFFYIKKKKMYNLTIQIFLK